MNWLHPKFVNHLAKLLLIPVGLTITTLPVLSQDTEEEVFQLSPFVVDASDDMGYYASQSLAGGRLSTDIINTGTSIEVVTADFMDDIGANDIQELLQYTTNTEIGGMLGNFTGAEVSASQGTVNTQFGERNPDRNARIRGLARPDNTRDYFKTDIPFDQYNTERIDINRGSNSFLFGLGSPAGLINNSLAKAHFKDRSETRFRLGSGGNRPSYRAEFDFNRPVIKDKLAIRVAGVMNRTQYRQQPAFRDDNRIYGTLTWHPFDNNKKTTIRAHWESGDMLSSPVSTKLPGENISAWVDHRLPINVDTNTRLYRNHYGYSAGDVSSVGLFNRTGKATVPPNPYRFDIIDDHLANFTGPDGWTNPGSYWASYKIQTEPYYNPRLNREEHNRIGKVDRYDSTPEGDKDTWVNHYVDGGANPLLPIGTIGSSGYSIVYDGRTSGPSFAFRPQPPGFSILFERGGILKWDVPREHNNYGKDRRWLTKTKGSKKPVDTRYKVWIHNSDPDNPGDPWWSPSGGLTNGNAGMRTYKNRRNIPGNGVGWMRQGFTNLDMFDFSKYNLSNGNDWWSKDFYNYNVTLEHLMLDGKAGVEVAYDYEKYTHLAQTYLSAAGAEIQIDINETIPLPQYANGEVVMPQYDPETNLPILDEKGFVVGGAMPNPNFGRPFIVSRRGDTRNYSERNTMRATGFYKLDFEEYAESRPWMKWLGAHTFSILGDKALEEYSGLSHILRSFGDDWDPGAHVADNSGTNPISGVRQVGLIAYIGPPVHEYLGDSAWDPNTPLSINDIRINPVNYNMRIEDGFSMPITYWSRGSWPDQIVDPETGISREAVVGTADQIDGDESWQQGNLIPRWTPNDANQRRRTEIESWAINAQSFFFNRHLVLNTGYREDYLKSWLNRGPPLDEYGVPDVSPDVFKAKDGDFDETIKGPGGSGTFGYGAVLHWPTQIIKLPASTDISFHYNFSKNFVPDNSRRSINSDIELFRLPAPKGESSDWGVTFQMFDRKLIVRLNWYRNEFYGADTSLGSVYNQNLNKAFAWYKNNNTWRVLLDADGTIYGEFDDIASNSSVIDLQRQDTDELLIDEVYGQYYDYLYDAESALVPNPDFDAGIEENFFTNNPWLLDEDAPLYVPETDQEVVDRYWPNWDDMVQARHELYAMLKKGYWQIKEERGRVREFEDGSIDSENITALTDLEDVVATGFEASITWNPTRSWRMRINVARQETVKQNTAPNLTRFIEEDWYPWVQKWGHLRWSQSAREVGSAETVLTNVDENLIEYFTDKQQEGFPNDEVREWRVNLVTNYTIRDGLLKNFSFGGSMRWQDAAAAGYPIIDNYDLFPGQIIPTGDINNPWYGEEDLSFDCQFGYRRKIGKKIDWQIQFNFKNLQNIDSDKITVLTRQPDGSPANVRWAPPFTWQVTNTFRW